MRVLHVMNSAGGGAALSTLGLMERLRNYGVVSSAVCHSAGSAAERSEIEEATEGRVLFTPLYWWNKKIRASLWKRPLLELRQLFQTGWGRNSTRLVRKFAQAQRAELIHSNTILTLEGAYASRQLGLPHVWHLRELVGPGNPFQFWSNGTRFGHFVARHCEALIANSNVTGAQIRNLVPSELLQIIPNGIDLSRFKRREPSTERSTLVVAMVANLTSRVKNHELFIRAAAEVSHMLPIEFRIYGTDPSSGGRVRGDSYIDGLHDLVHSCGLTSRLKWPGFRHDPTEIMDAIDILVHPTHQESFGRVVVEAMAAALPVVGVHGGGVGEIVSDGVTGWLVDPNDAVAMAARIEDLSNSPGRRREFGDAGRTRAESVYSLDICAGSINAVYQSLLCEFGRSISSCSRSSTSSSPL